MSGEKTQVICGPDYLFKGAADNSQLGFELTPMGDINEDGCDDIAVSALIEDQGATNQGQIWLVYGFNPNSTTCAFDRPQFVAGLAPGVSESRVGRSLAGGVDADGDGTPDLAVGAIDFRVGGQRLGAAFFCQAAT